MIPYSILDLAPIVEGGDAAQALRCSLDLSRHAERWGYQRYWIAEHHGMPGVASAATAVVISHIAAGTSRIRVGAGGIMLPHHAPLVLAEQVARRDVRAGVKGLAAATEGEARSLATSVEQAIVSLRTGRPGRLPPPSRNLRWGFQERALLDQALSCSAIGSPATVAQWLEEFAKRTGADEFIIAAQMFDHQARLRSYELTASLREPKRTGPPSPA